MALSVAAGTEAGAVGVCDCESEALASVGFASVVVVDGPCPAAGLGGTTEPVGGLTAGGVTAGEVVAGRAVADESVGGVVGEAGDKGPLGAEVSTGTCN